MVAHIIRWTHHTWKQYSGSQPKDITVNVYSVSSPLKEAERNSEMAVSSACFQVPRLLLIPSSRKQLLQTHRYKCSSRRTNLLHKCFSQQQSESKPTQKENEELEFERLFSNLNQATLKREPGFPNY